MKRMSEITSINLTKSTRDRLKSTGRMDETYDILINRLIDSCNKLRRIWIVWDQTYFENAFTSEEAAKQWRDQNSPNSEILGPYEVIETPATNTATTVIQEAS